MTALGVGVGVGAEAGVGVGVGVGVGGGGPPGAVPDCAASKAAIYRNPGPSRLSRRIYSWSQRLESSTQARPRSTPDRNYSPGTVTSTLRRSSFFETLLPACKSSEPLCLLRHCLQKAEA